MILPFIFYSLHRASSTPLVVFFKADHRVWTSQALGTWKKVLSENLLDKLQTYIVSTHRLALIHNSPFSGGLFLPSIQVVHMK